MPAFPPALVLPSWVKGRTLDPGATSTFEISLSLDRNNNSHERGRYKSADILALVLRFGQLHKLVVKFRRFPASLGCFDSVHGRSVECLKGFYQLCRACVGRRKVVCVLDHGNFLLGYTGPAKSLDDMTLHTPSHRADENIWRLSCERCTDLQHLRYERWIVRNPVRHYNASAKPCHPYHLLGHIEGFGRKHGAEHGEGQIERMVGDPLQVARIAFLKLQVAEARRRGSFVPGFNQVSGDIDSDNFSSQTGDWNCCGAIAAAQVQNLHLRSYPEGISDCFSRLTHERRNLCEIAFFPECFIWICDTWNRDTCRIVCHGVLRHLCFRLTAGPAINCVSLFRTAIVQCASGYIHARASR